MVEQRTENPCVGGSSPPLGTKRKLSYSESFFVIINYNHRTYAFGVSGVAIAKSDPKYHLIPLSGRAPLSLHSTLHDLKKVETRKS